MVDLSDVLHMVIETIQSFCLNLKVIIQYFNVIMNYM